MAKKTSKSATATAPVAAAAVGTPLVSFTPAAPVGGKLFTSAPDYVSAYAQNMCTLSEATIESNRKKLPEVIIEGEGKELDQESLDRIKRADKIWTEIAWMFNHPWFDKEVFWILLLFQNDERRWFVKKWAAMDTQAQHYVASLIQEATDKFAMMWMFHWLFFDLLENGAKDLAYHFLPIAVERLVEGPFQLGDVIGLLQPGEYEEWITKIENDSRIANLNHFYFTLMLGKNVDPDLKARLACRPGYDKDARKIILKDVLTREQDRAAFQILYAGAKDE